MIHTGKMLNGNAKKNGGRKEAFGERERRGDLKSGRILYCSKPTQKMGREVNGGFRGKGECRWKVERWKGRGDVVVVVVVVEEKKRSRGEERKAKERTREG